MHSRYLWIFGLVFITLGVAGAACADTAEIVFYHNVPVLGDDGPYSLTEVSIHVDGTVTVLRQEYGSKSLSSTYSLSAKDITDLRAMIRRSAFSELPKMPPSIIGTILRISLDGKSREFIFTNVPSKRLEPVLKYVDGFVMQACVMESVEQRDDTYTALAAVDSRLEGAKIPQPGLLVEPLVKYVNQGTNPSKLRAAVDALRWLKSPAEWAEMLESVWKSGDVNRRLLLIHTITPLTMASRSIPDEYQRALVGLYATMQHDGQAMVLSVSDRVVFLDSIKRFLAADETARKDAKEAPKP